MKMSHLYKTFSVKALQTILLALPLTTGWYCSDNPGSAEENSGDLPYVSPEVVGYSSELLQEAVVFGEQIGYVALMAAYDGKVFFSWGNTTYNYLCHSIRKPFLSALYGIYINEGEIDTSATMEELGIDDFPNALTAEEKQATVRNLLMARSGIYHEAAAEAQIMKEMRPERGSHPPGTFYYYNNWDFNALGTIFEQETETKIFEEYKSRISDPVGMQDFSINNCYYQYENELSMHPAYHFRMSARDMLRFGILYQKSGNWDGNQIITESWIDESTTAYSIVDTTYDVGYGFMWNVIPEGSAGSQLAGGHKIFFHTGIGVHMMMIIPDLKLVLVMRMDTDGVFTDPGDDSLELVLMILTATTD